MAITLHEVFRVQAPIEEVWRFMMDAERVAACMPGAALDEAVDGSTYTGSIRVKLGAITTSYRGQVRFVETDERAHTVQLVAEGRETGGGTAQGGMSSSLRELDGGAIEVTIEASVDVTGRVAQMGRGMIQGVSQQLFGQFVACARAVLEGGEGAALEHQLAAQKPVPVLSIALGVVWSSIVRFVRRLLRRDKPEQEG